MNFASSSNDRELLCAESDCFKRAIPNSNYCEDHQRGLGGLSRSLYEAIEKAIRSNEIGRVDKLEADDEHEKNKICD